jgi:hypothetical protein
MCFAIDWVAFLQQRYRHRSALVVICVWWVMNSTRHTCAPTRIDCIHVTLYWQIDQPLDGSFATTVEMTDDKGGVWGGKLDQPRNVLKYYQPILWQPGQVIRDDYDINLNPITPTGVYHIRIGVKGVDDGLFWPVSGAAASEQRAILTDVRIENIKDH